MPRPGPRAAATTTHLGAALRARREAESTRALGERLGLTHSTVSRIERGTHRPSYDTAKALAAWLGWSVEQVMEAAERPVAAGDADHG